MTPKPATEHVANQHILATRNGPTMLATVIELQDVWRSLTKLQRSVLLRPDLAWQYSPRTIEALTRKHLWDDSGITGLGRAVVQYRPREVTRG